jgi:hypothetical protein
MRDLAQPVDESEPRRARFDIDGMRNCARDEGGRGGEIPRATRLFSFETSENLSI